MSDKWITEDLESSDVGSYMGVPRNLLPEIFFEEELPAWEELHPRGGCRGLEVSIILCCTACTFLQADSLQGLWL